MNQSIRVLGTDWCPFCVKVTKYLKNKNIDFQWIDTDTAQGKKQRSAVTQKYKFNTVPIVFVNGQFIGGCDDFFSALNRKKIIL